MPTHINDLPAELLAKIFLEGTRTELVEEEGAWEDEDSVYTDVDDEEEHYSDAMSICSNSVGASPGSIRGRGTSHNGDSGPPIGEFPTLVSHVCRHWRNVSLNVPMLWTTLDFAEGPPYDKSKSWIERSGECDLDITVDHTGDEDMPSQPIGDLKKIMQLITPQVHRWRIIHISVSSRNQMRLVLRDFLYKSGPAPRLRSLSLYDNSTPEDDSDTESYDGTPPDTGRMMLDNHAPLLIEATFWGVALNWSECTFLRELENLELAYHDASIQPTWEEFASMLQASPSLKVLSIADSGPDAGEDLTIPWPDEPIIPLHSLHKLSIAFVTPLYASELIYRLDIPNLEELDLDLEDDTGMGKLIGILTAKRRNVLTRLRKLKCSALECTPPEVQEIYGSLTGLSSLTLNLHYLNHSFLHLLRDGPLPNTPSTPSGSTATSAPAPSSCSYLPQLEELTIYGVDDENIQLLKEVIDKRNAPPPLAFLPVPKFPTTTSPTAYPTISSTSTSTSTPASGSIPTTSVPTSTYSLTSIPASASSSESTPTPSTKKIKKLILCNQDTIDTTALAWFKSHVEVLELTDNLDDEDVSDSDDDSNLEGVEIGMIVDGFDDL